VVGVWRGPNRSTTAGGERRTFNAGRAGRAVWAAKWELLIPLVAIGALFKTTPVAAAAITALYTFFTQTVIHRDLNLRKNFHVLVECGLVIGGVLLILGVAQGFTNYLIFEQVPDQAIDWLHKSVSSPLLFLLLLNFFLLIVGGLMDVYPAIVVVAPLLVPIGEAYQVDRIHLGVVFLANLEMGFLMPPLGMNLLLASYRFKRPIPEVYRAILPILAVQFVAVLLITYVPPLTTLLPRLFAH
jgi:C4-dicarboxylate transporter DctM subunit